MDILRMYGELQCELYSYNDTQLPSKITTLHKYKRVDIFKGSAACNFHLYFYQFELTKELNNPIAADDFTEGVWIPASQIRYCQLRYGYYYQDVKISTSNAMLIEMMQGRQISKTILDEEIFQERHRHSKEKKNLAKARFFNSDQSPVVKKSRIDDSNNSYKI